MHYKYAILAVMAAAASAQTGMDTPGMNRPMPADDPTKPIPTGPPKVPGAVAPADDPTKPIPTGPPKVPGAVAPADDPTKPIPTGPPKVPGAVAPADEPTKPIPTGKPHAAEGALPKMPMFDNTTLSGQCKEIHDLTKYTKFAANETLVQLAVQQMSATPEQITQFKANATIASAELKEMEKNKTLIDTCAKVDQVHGECKKMDKLNKLEKLVHNDTMLAAYQAKKNLTDAQITELKAHAAKENDKIDAMNKNTTLLSQCQSLKENKKAGMNPVDAAMKAANFTLPPTSVQNQNSAKAASTMAAKSAASAVIGSSFLAVVMASAIVLFT